MLTFSRMKTKSPHSFNAFLCALYAACAGLIDKGATLDVGEEMYAVFAEEDAVTLTALLLLGLARHTRAPAFSSEERKQHVLLHVKAHRRICDIPLGEDAVLPAHDGARRLIERLAHEGDIRYLFSVTKDEIALSVAYPRFLTKSFDVCAVDPKQACDLFYKAMLMLAENTQAPLSE